MRTKSKRALFLVFGLDVFSLEMFFPSACFWRSSLFDCFWRSSTDDLVSSCEHHGRVAGSSALLVSGRRVPAPGPHLAQHLRFAMRGSEYEKGILRSRSGLILARVAALSRDARRPAK